MSGFDFSELLPYYLDETDEQVGALNDSLLRLERDPSDAPALQDTFRIVHSLKGSSSVMGFDQVNRLAHHLETLFDQLRSGKRTLDREAMELSFRCLDRLRDFHKALREEGEGGELGELVDLVIAYLERTASPPGPAVPTGPGHGAGTGTRTEPDEIAPPAEATPLAEGPPPPPHPDPGGVAEGPIAGEGSPAGEGPPADEGTAGDAAGLLEGRASAEGLAVTVEFVPTLQWRDMKARLILNRLASRVRVLGSDPPADRLDEVESRATFIAWVEPEADRDELRALADVDGVASIRFGDGTAPGPEAGPPTGSSGIPPAATTAEAPESPTPTPMPTPGRAGVGPPGPEPAGATEAVVGRSSKRAKIAETLRVDVERLDLLMNLAGELVISRARFADLTVGLEDVFRASDARLLAADSQDRIECLAEGLDAVLGSSDRGGVADRWRSQFRRLSENIRDLRAELDRVRHGRDRLSEMSEAIDQLGRVCDQIQKGVLDTRMVPIGPLFERFRRVVRDLTVDSGKEVTLELQGEATELDKRMIDELSDPLIHMVRNAVDHGLESPEARERAGKPRAGRVTLAAAHRGNRVVVTVADDGRGLPVDRIRQKVAERGLLPEAEAARLSTAEVIPYIFHPGLSTAEAVTNISGRGVGMDIVKDGIEQLNGSVAVRTEPGRGTTFTIRLPLTLAIMPSLLIRIFDEIYALPLAEIREIVDAGPDQILDVQGSRAIEVRGRVISLFALDDVFEWGGRPHPARGGDGPPGAPRTRPVVVVQSSTATVGLVVDELIGIQEIVLKSIEKNYRPVRGLSGASILGNGRVALILDVDALIELATRGPSTRTGGGAQRRATTGGTG
ncbi:chemotaxis protein CheW [Tautonia plasticadhaerens]|uniref:Chemotaxis protein CheA n=1 Tax=Tautonia plasticadhaerens TaxID=2527974 RepID=A0A518H7K0_9BACT|nr:chemotaxis protein CheW [Tautonia plasticadhaerens]QDV36849.1 Chemotaxis protein CheA [Tautonia plasticadhaerens]